VLFFALFWLPPSVLHPCCLLIVGVAPGVWILLLGVIYTTTTLHEGRSREGEEERRVRY